MHRSPHWALRLSSRVGGLQDDSEGSSPVGEAAWGSALAIRVAEDPFKKVKKMIKDLIVRPAPATHSILTVLKAGETVYQTF